MEAFSFGSYYAGRSFVHRLDPRTKLLAGFGFLFIALASHTFPALAVLAIGIGVSYALARIPAHYAVRSMAPLMVLVAFVAILTLFTEQGGRVLFQLGFIQISEGSIYSCCFIACRMFLMMCGMSLVTMAVAGPFQRIVGAAILFQTVGEIGRAHV